MCCEPVRRQQPSVVGPNRQAVHCDLDPVPASVGLARTFVRAAASALGEDVTDVCVLLTSELVTNAVLHARTPVQVGVVVDDEQVLVSVEDRLPAKGPLRPRAPLEDGPGGRGLAIVADVSEDWGTAGHAHGKSVWFVVSRHSAAVIVG